MDGCNDCVNGGSGCQDREDVFKARVQVILGALACQYPSLFIKVDLWRPKVLDLTDEYSDEDKESWIRLGEQVDAFILDQNERFYQADVGILNQTTRYLLIAAGMDLHPDDHVVIAGQPFLISEAVEQMGVGKYKLDKTKQRFQRPGRFAPVYREIGIKAAIL